MARKGKLVMVVVGLMKRSGGVKDGLAVASGEHGIYSNSIVEVKPKRFARTRLV